MLTGDRAGVPPREGESDRGELASFLLFWLCHDVFEHSPRDTIKNELIPMVVLMSRGVSFPLDPIFLGGLYHHLDLVARDILQVDGDHEI